VFTIDDTNLNLIPAWVNDSKQVSKLRREYLYLPLCAVAAEVGIGHAWPWEIDEMSPLPALQLSYTRALEELHFEPEILFVDGSEFSNKVRSFYGQQIVEPKGDAKYKQIGAASIIAKVFRDGLMAQESERMGDIYGWCKNSGYGTPDHAEAIRKHGLLINHPNYYHRKRYCNRFMNLGKPTNDR
jgi:ribonuclease HII